MKYKGMMDVLRKTYNKEGFRGLYKVGSSLPRTFECPSLQGCSDVGAVVALSSGHVGCWRLQSWLGCCRSLSAGVPVTGPAHLLWLLPLSC